MGKETGIQWCHHTFNPWIGCTKVSDGCKFCYAETLNNRWKGGNWGPGAPRRITSKSNWSQPPKWDKEAAAAKERRRVFCASLADVFDEESPEGGQEALWPLIEKCSNLDFLLLTKRPINILDMVPPEWSVKPRFNVWYGTTVEDSRVVNRIELLRKVPAQCRFLSVEPLIGNIDWGSINLDGIHWMIFGGESGQQARPLDLNWIRDGIRICRQKGIAPFVKQLGQNWSKSVKAKDSHGGDPMEWPEDLRVREFPSNIIK
jgi:protein gp37